MTTPDEHNHPQDAQLRTLLTEALDRPVPCPRCSGTRPCRCYVPAEQRLAARVDVLLDALRPVLHPPAIAAASRLPPYSRDNPRCPKCGHRKAYTHYHDGYGLICEATGAVGEHLCRECAHCDYPWAEALVPQPPDDQPGPDGERPATRVTITCHGHTEVLKFVADKTTELECVNAERRAQQAESRLAGQRDLLGRWAAEYDRIMTLLSDATKAGRDISTRELRQAIEPLTAIATTARDQDEERPCSPSS